MEGKFRLASRGWRRSLYRLCGVKADLDMGWLQYALAILLFNGLGVLVVYAVQRHPALAAPQPAGHGEHLA